MNILFGSISNNNKKKEEEKQNRKHLENILQLIFYLFSLPF